MTHTVRQPAESTWIRSPLCYHSRMTKVVMERRFDVPPTDEELAAMKEKTEVCLEVNDAVRVETLSSTDRKRFICIFEGRDLESVRRAVESAGVQYESIWSATSF
ncbi:MAG: DUF4242 domain-containing protein [Thermoanaerobaculia bacterium]|nr:DUF4242 domain-containing protein [Thermoanaerobaculia bacterium]